jgi:hypothetical protein
VSHPTYTAAEIDAAIETLLEPERMRHAEEIVTHAAPGLQRVLAEALRQGGWFGPAHDAEIARAAAEPDQSERTRALATLVAEQTRLGMFVGVAVGFELAHALPQAPPAAPTGSSPHTPAQGHPEDRARENLERARPHDPPVAHPTTYRLPIHISPSQKNPPTTKRKG